MSYFVSSCTIECKNPIVFGRVKGHLRSTVVESVKFANLITQEGEAWREQMFIMLMY